MRATRLAAVVGAALTVSWTLVWYAAPAAADDVRDAQWHLEALRVAGAHQLSQGAGVTVAVLDSGVDASHPDLRGSVRPGVDLTGRGSDGRDDPTGAGTALAGLIAGHGHGDASGQGDAATDGVLGLAPSAEILPVVVVPPGASPDPDTLAAGIDAAVRGGADVICIGRGVPDHPDVRRELGAAVSAGVAVVVPAATAADPLARYGGAGLLGAVPAGEDAVPAGEDAAPADQNPAPATGSATAGAVIVPAVGVTSTGADGGYYRYARSSDPAGSAVLAGAVALVRGAYPDLSGPEVAQRIEESSAGGVLDLVASLTENAPPSPSPTAAPPSDPPTPSPPPQERVAAFDSGDWRRWVVATPLVLFLVVLVAASVAGAPPGSRGRRRAAAPPRQARS